METISAYLIKFLWVLGVGSALWGINWLAQKGYFNKTRYTKGSTVYRFDMTNWNVYFRIFSAVLLVTVALSACSSSESPTEAWVVLGVGAVLVAVLFEPVRRALKKREGSTVAPAPVAKSPVGKWVGEIVQANQIAWADANDEHTPTYTAQVLAQEPSWRGLQYCPGGTFSFEVHPDGSITGGAVIFITHPEPVQGRPVLANDATEIEFNLASHKVRLKFDGDTVTGLLWEGHDLLKRANIVGNRV